MNEELIQALMQSYGMDPQQAQMYARNAQAEMQLAPLQEELLKVNTFSRPSGHAGNILEGVIEGFRRPKVEGRHNEALMDALGSRYGLDRIQAQMEANQQQREQEELQGLYGQLPGMNPAEAGLRARGADVPERKDTRTTLIKNAEAMGLKPGSPEFNEYMRQATVRGPGTTVNVGTDTQDPAAKSYFSERGKADSKALDEVYAQGDVAQKLKGQLGSFKEVLQGVQTGSMSNVRADVGRLAASLGMELDPDVDALQAGRALANQLALTVRNPESGMGMPGQVSNRDIQFLKEAMPRITNTPGGNEMIIEVFSRLADRSIERAQAASEFEQRHGRFDKAAFEREWAEYSEQNSLFDDLQVQGQGAPEPPPGFELD